MTRQATLYKIIKRDESIFPFEIPHFEREFRNSQWQSSRGALFSLLIELGFTISKAEDLEIHSFYTLKKYPEILTSLSHHRDYGAAIISNEPNILGVGIDIEANDRELKPGTERFFNHERDQYHGSPLEKWMAKEAAFKAIFPFWKDEKTFVLTDIWIKGHSFGYGQKELGMLDWFEGPDHILGCKALLLEELS